MRLGREYGVVQNRDYLINPEHINTILSDQEVNTKSLKTVNDDKTMWWLLAGIIYWLWWTVATSSGEAEEHNQLARKRHGSNDYKKNITEW